MKRIYFVRHGESEANVDLAIAKVNPDSSLTEKGRQQAERAGRDLRGKNIDLVVSSPMVRAMETSKIICGVIGMDPSQIVENSLFAERSYGIYGSDEDENSKYMSDLARGKLHKSAESTISTYERAVAGLGWLKDQQASRILLVSHGGVGRMIKLIESGLEHSKFYEVDKLGNSEIYEFEI